MFKQYFVYVIGYLFAKKKQKNQMRALIICVALTISISSVAQIENGLNKEEVRDMIALCNSFFLY